MDNQQQITHFLNAFRTHLRSVAAPERDEIIREIGAHIRDAAEEPGTSVAEVLARLGPPAALARGYADEALLQRARQSTSPALLLRAALRLATRGVSGVLVFLVTVFGYAIGAGLALTALAKLFFPSHTGLWVRNGQLETSGVLLYTPQAPSHEVLGWWYVPLALCTGVLLIWLTTTAVRSCLRLSRRAQGRLGLQSPLLA